jgi:hypothetical protein
MVERIDHSKQRVINAGQNNHNYFRIRPNITFRIRPPAITYLCFYGPDLRQRVN